MTTTPPEAPVRPGRARHRRRADRAAPASPATRSATSAGCAARVTDRKVAGVAGGLARHLDVDPIILRVAFVVLAFFGGAGLLLYGACWLLVPEEGTDEAADHLDERSRTVALIGVGVLAALALLGDSWGGFWFPWPLAIIALVVLLFVTAGPVGAPAAPTGPHVGPGLRRPGTVAASNPAPDQTSPSARGAPEQTPDRAGPTGWTPTRTPPSGTPRRPTSRTAVRVPAGHAGRSRPAQARTDPVLVHAGADRAGATASSGIVDVAGAGSPTRRTRRWRSASPALMLLVGAFYGRAGGLILVGLSRAVALGGHHRRPGRSTAPPSRDPATAAAGRGHATRSRAGELVARPHATSATSRRWTAGRSASTAGVGRIEVHRARRARHHVTADVDGPGEHPPVRRGERRHRHRA